MSETLTAKLQTLGFSEYEAKAYIALVSLGSPTAYEISDFTEVPYPKVYSVLAKLEKRGLVEVSRGRPMRFRALPLKQALTTIKDSIIDRLELATQKALEELEPIHKTISTRQALGTWNIVGKRNVINKLKEILEYARTEILLSFPDVENSLLDSMTPILKRAKKRGVSIKLLTPLQSKAYLRRFNKVAELRFARDVASRYVVVDNIGSLMISIAKSEIGSESWSGVWATCCNCLQQSQEHFRYAWSDAKRLFHN